MKKLWILSVISVLVMMFSSCGLNFDLRESDGTIVQPPTEESKLANESSSSHSEPLEYTNRPDESKAESGDESAEPESLAAVLDLPAVEEAALDVKPFDIVSYYNTPVSFLVFEGTVSFGGDTQVFTFTAGETGVYYFGFNVTGDLSFDIEIVDSMGCKVIFSAGLGGGEGVVCGLEKGETYEVIVTGCEGLGDYTLTIGQQKPEVDVTGVNYIADSVEFENQENYYVYTPAVSGTYRFYLSDIKSECRFSVYLYDSAGNLLQCITDVSGGDGINESLAAEETYRIGVVGYYGCGAYSLKIGAQKPTTELNAYVHISDNLEFAGQVNNYSLTTSVAGKYRFEVISDDKEIKPMFFVYDDGGNCIARGSDLPAGEGINAELEADSVYTFSVVENGKTGFYQFVVIAPAPAVDISDYGVVNNYIIYNGQYHTYTFTASESRDYCFGLANTNSGFSVDAEIFDNSGYSIQSKFGMTEGDSITVGLAAGETYTVMVAYCSGGSSYSLHVD